LALNKDARPLPAMIPIEAHQLLTVPCSKYRVRDSRKKLCYTPGAFFYSCNAGRQNEQEQIRASTNQ
jgi:hypothetical protein